MPISMKPVVKSNKNPFSGMEYSIPLKRHNIQDLKSLPNLGMREKNTLANPFITNVWTYPWRHQELSLELVNLFFFKALLL